MVDEITEEEFITRILETVELSANKATSLSATPSDERYLSENAILTLPFLQSYYLEDVGGVNHIHVTLPSIPNLTWEELKGVRLSIKMAATNTDTTDIEVSPLDGTKNVVKLVTLPLEENDLLVDGIYEFVYDGANMQATSKAYHRTIKTSTPSISSPIHPTDTSVSGTSAEADGTVIALYGDSVSIGTGTVSSGAWTVSGLSLTPGEVLTATALATGKTVSVFCTGVVVEAGAKTATPVIIPPVTTTDTTISGTSSEGNGTAITVYTDGSQYGTTTVTSGQWSVTGSPISENVVLTATALASGKSVSDASDSVTVHMEALIASYNGATHPIGGGDG